MTALERLRAQVEEACIWHLSDCAVHNEPAYPNGPCDCEVGAFYRLARALCDPGTVEAACRVLHDEQGSGDADSPLHAPYESSWEKPSWKRWQQWSETAKAILNLLAEMALKE